MNFYYDPILGLSYSGFPILEINLDFFNTNRMSWEEALELMNTKGIVLENSACQYEEAIRPILNITTEFIA